MNYSMEELYERYPKLTGCREDIDRAFQIMLETVTGGGTIFVCGNGGSAADSEHIIGELMKGFLKPRRLSRAQKEAMVSALGSDGERLADKLQNGIKAVSLNGHPSLSSAYANDVDSTMVFAQQVFVLGESGDCLLGLTTSGNSRNVMNTLLVSKSAGLKTIAMTGSAESGSSSLADCTIRVPEKETYRVQELHLPVYHALCAALEERIYGDGKEQ